MTERIEHNRTIAELNEMIRLGEISLATCVFCNVGFRPNDIAQKYCGPRCSKLAKVQRRGRTTIGRD